jgi:metallophosphoesterase (TIGR00282 family)
LGDHVWDQKELEEYLDQTDRVIRPANFPDGVPGCGFCVHEAANGQKVAVINLIGRVFMRHLVESPFVKVQQALEAVKKLTPVVIVDMHAETTSEKVAMGLVCDGEASAVVGTHTHIQTCDEKILPKGTAYITDLGMCGPYDSVIGQNKEAIIKRFLTSMPIRFQVAKSDIELHGVVLDIDEESGRARSIERLCMTFEMDEEKAADPQK